jgi:capsular polysaccharide transport system ATP-binding protein
MIVFENVSKFYQGLHLRKVVHNNLNFRIEPGESIGICGANGAGKSTLMRMIAGIEFPSSGVITRTMSVSWPIGFASCFQHNVTGADNVRFIARIYGKNVSEMLDFVEDFAQLGLYLDQPVQSYSSGMVARLAFGASLAINFDCYLVDEVTGAGDARFRKRCDEELLERRNNATLLMTSHDPYTLQHYCRRGAVLYGGSLTFFDTIEEACDVHQALQMRAA